MGQGQDKIARSLVELQPTAIIELFQLYFNTTDGRNNYISFHGGTNFSSKITWGGVAYQPIPVETEGFEVNANGQMARPKLRMSNKDRFVTTLLNNNQDLQFAKVIRRRTFVKYLDDENFDGGNPWGQADPTAEVSYDTFVISQKTAENRMFVEFELSSPLDLDNFEVNNRLIMSRYCSWQYRGVGCNYVGPPIETEDGKDLPINITTINNWSSISSQNGAWVVNKTYAKGDAVFLENTKVILAPDPNKPTVKRFARIWYVCQRDHLSAADKQPDQNTTYWLRDGCNKKLDGCKKRFQDSPLQSLGKESKSLTFRYMDFSYKKGWETINNVAPLATATASSYFNSDYRASNAIDGETGFNGTNTFADQNFSWMSSQKKNNPPTLNLKWSSPKTIDRIDFYDRPALDSNISGARIVFYTGNSNPVNTGFCTNIPSGGGVRIFGFPAIAVNEIQISGSGSYGTGYIGLGEVAVFEPTGSGVCLASKEFRVNQVHRKPHWHIASYFDFPKKLQTSDDYYSVFHNVLPNCLHSGINVYVQGGDTPEIFLSFAVVSVSGSSPVSTVIPKTLRMEWNPTTFQPLHIQCVGGNSAGEGYIVMSNDKKFVKYSLQTRNKAKNFSGEYFKFKDASRQGGIGDFVMGLNNWQFTNTTANPRPTHKKIRSNIKTTSNIRFGSTAIWTGSQDTGNRVLFFNRSLDEKEKPYEKDLNQFARTHGEIPPDLAYIKKDLFAWWDMTLNKSSYPYFVDNEQSNANPLRLSGIFDSRVNTSESFSFTLETGIPQSRKTYLPFGGFPGTDRYGR